MPAGAAFFADAELSHIQTDVVRDHDQFCRIVHLKIVYDLPEALSAQVHEGLGLSQEHLLACHITLADQCLMLALHDGDIFFLC